MTLQNRNRKIIEAVIQKEKQVCPGSLALIGIAGSFATGDIYEKSDLDLLIVINDEEGWKLGSTFIQEDLGVGHDLYCTTWQSLEEDAAYPHPNIAKLMDAKVVYCAAQEHQARLENLRAQARQIMDQPFSREDFEKAEALLKEAEHYFARAVAAQNMTELYDDIGGVLYYAEDAVAMLNKTYYRLGVKRRYRELQALQHQPESFCQRIEKVLCAEGLQKGKAALMELMQSVEALFAERESTLPDERPEPTAEHLRGTYEEMVSNWKNKFHLAAKEQDRHLAFMSMTSMDAMAEDIEKEVRVVIPRAVQGFEPQDLCTSAEAAENVLQTYRKEYDKLGLPVKSYADVNAFAKDYLKN